MKGGTEMFLVKQAQRGDADAFVALIEKYKMDLYKVAKACLKNEEDVADVMQETTLSAWEHIGELKKAAYFKTWLTRILINNCNNVLRERKRCIATEDFSMQGEEPQAKTFCTLVRKWSVSTQPRPVRLTPKASAT